MRPIRVYADTSVFGGVFDPEFEKASRMFFQRVHIGVFTIVVSAVVRDELREAPTLVRSLWEETIPLSEFQESTEEAVALQQAYLKAGILTPSSERDALHVALASVARCSMIVSWNFNHIVNYRKIPRYNAVNSLEGYAPIQIYSPLEVVRDEED